MDFNAPDFILNDSKTSIYIVEKKLIQRTLLPVVEGKLRKVRAIYTSYVFTLFFSSFFLYTLFIYALLINYNRCGHKKDDYLQSFKSFNFV